MALEEYGKDDVLSKEAIFREYYKRLEQSRKAFINDLKNSRFNHHIHLRDHL